MGYKDHFIRFRPTWRQKQSLFSKLSYACKEFLMRSIFVHRKKGEKKVYLKRDIYIKNLSNFLKPHTAQNGHLSVTIGKLRSTRICMGILASVWLIQGYLVFFSPFFLLQHIDIEGNESIKKEDIVAIINNRFSQKRFFFFSERNFFFFDESQLLLDLSKSISTDGLFLDIDPLRRTIHLRIKEKKVEYLLRKNDSLFTMDAEGNIVSDVTQSSQAFDLLVIDFASEREVSVGASIFEPHMLLAATQFQKQIHEKTDIGILSFSVFESAPNDLLSRYEEQQSEAKEDQKDETINESHNIKTGDEKNEGSAEDVFIMTTEDRALETFLPKDGVSSYELVAKTDHGFDIFFGNPILYDSEEKQNHMATNIILAYQSLVEKKKIPLEYFDARVFNRIYYK